MLKFLSTRTFQKFIRNPRRAFVKGRDRIYTQIVAKLGYGYSRMPTNLTFFLTYRCNLRCPVCGQWGKRGYVKGFSQSQLRDEVDIATLKKVIDDIAQFRPHITLCGGEVMLYDGWLDFMRHIKMRQLECVLTTNGTMLEKYSKDLVEIGLDKLSLSLDGPETIHNQARGSDNAFSRVMEGLVKLKDYKTSRKVIYPELEIGCTISDQNYRHLDDIIEIAESLGSSCLILLHLIFISEQQWQQQDTLFRNVFGTESIHWSGYRYPPGGVDVEFLAEKIEQIKAKKYKMPVVVHPDFTREEILEYYREPVFLSKSYRNKCLAPWTTAYILPNGDVSPCSSFVAGNIKNQSIKATWNNERFRFFRTELQKCKRFPVCSRCCEFYKY